MEHETLPFRITRVHPGFYWIRVAKFLIFCAVFYRSLLICPFTFSHTIIELLELTLSFDLQLLITTLISSNILVIQSNLPMRSPLLSSYVY